MHQQQGTAHRMPLNRPSAAHPHQGGSGPSLPRATSRKYQRPTELRSIYTLRIQSVPLSFESFSALATTVGCCPSDRHAVRHWSGMQGRSRVTQVPTAPSLIAAFPRGVLWSGVYSCFLGAFPVSHPSQSAASTGPETGRMETLSLSPTQTCTGLVI